MTRDDVLHIANRMIEERGGARIDDKEELLRFAVVLGNRVAVAERDRTSRLVADMQAELQALRDRLARQKPRIWVYRDNPGLTTDREPGRPDLWEPLGPIV